jgi:hypothetical protein
MKLPHFVPIWPLSALLSPLRFCCLTGNAFHHPWRQHSGSPAVCAKDCQASTDFLEEDSSICNYFLEIAVSVS